MALTQREPVILSDEADVDEYLIAELHLDKKILIEVRDRVLAQRVLMTPNDVAFASGMRGYMEAPPSIAKFIARTKKIWSGVAEL